ncbi:unnamed protein product [Vitrella brassicaformis CCMP3155]|uniref:Potassium channel tetramerisation-type BTB domain-containing protein n=1 Tax=Vitrella brassicaformis (strain CCMP3155) TaxID=1169540 RepID=A0A0G4ES09_VITBC|nr:unnamed protein product [Vitrella brassicaformis CCMP3155]|eukprot:CEM01011.1 unnamed protein product [Vitrella brassicaformis CCMP3155]
MAELTRVDVTSRFDNHIVTLLEGLDAQRTEVASAYDFNKLLSDHGGCDGAASGDDQLQLNVGGRLFEVRRKHLTSVKDTLLGALFGGRWDSRLIPLDGHGQQAQRVFVDVCPRAFEVVHEALLEGKPVVDQLMADAKTRNYQGDPMAHTHGRQADRRLRNLSSRLLHCTLPPIQKPFADVPEADVRNEVTVTTSGESGALGAFIGTMQNFIAAYQARQKEIDTQRQELMLQHGELTNEIKAVTPFFAPLMGADPIRSVSVCGHSISTVQSTLDNMGCIALSNRFDMWPSPIEDVPVDHIGRLIDYYRRKRHAASLTDTQLLGGVRMPLLVDGAARQESFNKTAAMYGVETHSKPVGQLLEEKSEEGTCVLCLDRPPTVVYFPCKMQCVCAACHERLLQRVPRAARPGSGSRAGSLYRDHHGLRCPACRSVVEYATEIDGARRTA